MNVQEKSQYQVTAHTIKGYIQASSRCSCAAFPMGCDTDDTFGVEYCYV